VPRALKLSALALGALLLVGLALGWLSRDAWVTGMLVLAPSPELEVHELPQGVRQRVDVQRADAVIRAWVFDPPTAPRGTVLMLHGIRSDKRSLVPGARRHASHGLRAVAVDLRGHGESSGRYLTYGVEESRDLWALVDELERRALLVRPLSVVGSSYGAATALQYAALDPRVDKVVAMAPFASLREVVPAYLAWFFGGPARLVPSALVDALVDGAARHAGFDPDRACPRCVAGRIHAAVLLIHSRDDERIPWQQSVELREALGAKAQLMLVEGEGHVRVGHAPGVTEAIDRWLQ